MKSKRKQIIAALVVIILLLAIGIYWQRNQILHTLIDRKIKKYEDEKSVKFTYDKICFSSSNTIQIDNLILVPQNQDTLFSIQKTIIEVNLKKLFCREIEAEKLEIDDIHLRLTENNNQWNFAFLLHNKKRATNRDAQNYAQKISRMLALFFNVIPENISISNLNVILQNQDFMTRIDLPELKIRDGHIYSQISVKEEDKIQNLILDGNFRHHDKYWSSRLYSREKKTVELPFLQNKYQTQIRFDTLQFCFCPVRDEQDLFQLKGDISFNSLYVLNEKLSNKEVFIEKNKISYIANIFPNHVEIDSATTVQVNRLSFHPYLYVKQNPEPHFILSITKNDFPAEDLFESLPHGLFENLKGIKTAGRLSYNFYFELDKSNIDNLKFHSSLKKKDFHIIQFGQTDFTQMGEPFLHSVYENGEHIKTFEVGESNPDFRTLDAISPYLKSAVLFSEDGFFYTHSGFVEEAFRTSIIKNLKEERFARGGSTISMQLIKNLYLSKDKTLMRKIEEVLIVWLIEENRLVSKDRMYEVYLNIIEWGPGIYGANEATRFYFNKDVADITPEEAIFMASIIARPKKFKWFFDKNRELRPFMAQYYQTVGKRMLNHNHITEKQFEKLTPHVKITGAALSYLAGNDQHVILEIETQDESEWTDISEQELFLKKFKKEEKP